MVTKKKQKESKIEKVHTYIMLDEDEENITHDNSVGKITCYPSKIIERVEEKFRDMITDYSIEFSDFPNTVVLYDLTIMEKFNYKIQFSIKLETSK